ncbi:MAG: AMP-binding protein [Pelagibacterales bacterium]|nr:AMP-binding protein [Pelagibacterales bacterium]
MNKNKILIYDNYNSQISYNDIFKQLQTCSTIKPNVQTEDLCEFINNLICCLIHNIDVVLFDDNFSDNELKELGYSSEDVIKNKNVLSIKNNITYEWFHYRITKSQSNITLFTSGTTGISKKITHPVSFFIKSVKIGNKYTDNIWGFAYSITHIAGIQVFFQAICNMNMMINIFDKQQTDIFNLINKYSITHISSTPTFFRILYSNINKFMSIKAYTLGGEKSTKDLIENVEKMFPNAKITNIYASTEAGAVFFSRKDIFYIKDELSQLVKIVNNEILLHKSLIGKGSMMIKDWYKTGDMVEVLSNNPLSFKFFARKNEMINCGGHKVNPNEVEEKINCIPGVIDSNVFSKENSVIGNILMADVVGKDISEKYIRNILIKELQPFKIPRIINFVKMISKTKTGKTVRK